MLEKSCDVFSKINQKSWSRFYHSFPIVNQNVLSWVQHVQKGSISILNPRKLTESWSSFVVFCLKLTMIQQRLGGGAYGEVFTINFRGRGACVKRMNIEEGLGNITDRKEWNRCFWAMVQVAYTEIHMLSSVSHSCIIGFEGAYYTHRPFVFRRTGKKTIWNPYMIMQKMDMSLSRLIHLANLPSTNAHHIRLSEGHVQNTMARLIAAIAYMHRSGVIHFDIKPGNILVNKDCTTKLCDFGIADCVPDNKIMTYKRVNVTLWYRCPELLKQLDHTFAVDMWSVGCVFGELLIGKPLFPGKALEKNPFANVPGQPPFIQLSTDQQEKNQDSCIATKLGMKGGGFTTSGKELFLNNMRRHCHLKREWVPSDEALDLLWSLLMVDPLWRITAETAIKHPYIWPFVKKYNLYGHPNPKRVRPTTWTLQQQLDILRKLGPLNKIPDSSPKSGGGFGVKKHSLDD